MQSKIEDTIRDIEDYIEGCKGNMFNPNKITIDKEEFLELIEELKAQALIDDASNKTNQMVSEHEIVQAAYAQSDEVIRLATEQAQEILDNATMEANQIKESAIAYTDEMMANVEKVLAQAMNTNEKKYNETQRAMEEYYNVLKSNRAELYPDRVEETTLMPSMGTGEINLDMV